MEADKGIRATILKHNIAMELQLENRPSGYSFDSITENSVVIGETCYSASLVVSSEKIISDWPPQHWSQISPDDLDIILALRPELILVGTGKVLQFLDSNILKTTVGAGVGVEFMDSRAACRTYNLLSAEGRRVVAGIIVNPTISDL